MTSCPNDLDEAIELYCLNRLEIGRARRLEAHLAQCPACLYEMLDADTFIETLVEALKEMSQACG